MRKTYLNFIVIPKGNSSWFDVFKDGKFLAAVPDENVARAVIKKELGNVEFITAEMMSDG
ncbi:MAG: hypothetical protein WCW84_13880 [Sulfurimonas sp.]|jgi:hypothetical protein